MTFDHPPTNSVSATTVAELAELVDLIEQDVDLSVVVFDSANPDFYLAEYDDQDDACGPAALPARPIEPAAWTHAIGRLALAPVVSIASIRGCACCAGTEFVLACDLRFASRENTLIGQFELGGGTIPRRKALARLSHLVGAGRALEILFVGDDLDGPRAEQYGCVNRLIADDQLDGEVDRIASRLGRFDRDTIRRAKSWIDEAVLPMA